jgi:hypothetical protein
MLQWLLCYRNNQHAVYDLNTLSKDGSNHYIYAMLSCLFTIKGKDAQPVCETFVRMHHQIAHESVYPGGFIRLYEDYSFLNGNDMVVCIRVDATEAASDKMLIEFIAGGENDDIFKSNDSWGSGNRRLKKFANDLQDFCNENQLQLSV